MRYSRRFAPVVVGLILVLGAALLIGRARSLRAQPPLPPLAEEPAKSRGGLEPAPGEPRADVLPGAAEAGALPVPDAGPAPAPGPEDPDKAAEKFMDQTRQQADAQIKALMTEAEQLRARLKKIESAIGRWQSLRSALDQKPVQREGLAEPALTPVTPPLSTTGTFELPADAPPSILPPPGPN